MTSFSVNTKRHTRGHHRICFLVLAALWLTAVGFSPVLAQSEGCGTVVTANQVTAEKDRALRFPGIGDAAEDDSTLYAIPLALHIVRRTNGTGGLSTTELDSAMDLANDLFAQSNIYAYQYGPIDFVDSDNLYTDCDESSEFDFLRAIHKVPEAINIYFLPSESGFPYCGLSSFTTSATQGILMANSCVIIGGASSTLVHEIGHYFDLYHTHETAFAVECPDGSNCSSAGDRICDTPADPNLSGHVSDPPDCAYDDYASPPAECTSTPYAPQPDNIMSYANKPCRDLFTAGQTSKFRTILENDRTELAVAVGGVFAYPGAIDYGSQPLGATVEDSVALTYILGGTVDILSAASAGGNLTIGGALPVTIDNSDTVAFSVTFDASSLTGECDRGMYFDTVLFTTTDTENPVLQVPVSLVLGFATAGLESDSLTTQCSQMTIDNRAGMKSFARGGNNSLYDASLMVGLLDGSDTTVYRSLFGGGGLMSIDFIASAGNTRSFDISSVDTRIQGSVTYSFNPTHADSCEYVIVDYELYNPCGTALQILTGLMGDFDLGDSQQNLAGYDAARNTVYMTNFDTTQVVGMALLSGSPRNLRAVNNPIEVWPGFTDGSAYSHLASTTNVDGSSFDDWSMVITFGQDLVGPGDTARFTVAMMYSISGVNGLAAIYDKITAPASCCLPPTVGDVDQSGVVDITDVSVLVDNQFLTLTPLVCFDEGDMDFSGAVDVTDLSILIDNQFLTLTGLPACP